MVLKENYVIYKNKLGIGFAVFLFLSIAFFWLLYLDNIGLHGDESWLGLKAWEYLQHGINQPYGMNRYTGILQSLIDAFAFKFWGVGIVQLRVVGVCFNIISIVLLIYFFYKKQGLKPVVFFLLFIAQSAFYLVELKIAWEVCSFNLFFLSISIITLLANQKNKSNKIFVFLFLFSSLLGVYNHIIFSSLPLSLLIGIYLWHLMNKSNKALDIRMLSVLILNMMNIIFLFLFMHFLIDFLWVQINFLSFIIPLTLILIELIFLEKIINVGNKVLIPIFNINISRNIIIGFLIICVILFLIFHGVLFFQLLAQEIIFLRLFSYTLPKWMALLLVISAFCIFLYFVYCLVIDVKKNSQQPYAFIIITYLGVFNLYNNGSAIRYLIICIFLVFIYLAIKLSIQKGVIRNIVAITLILNILLVQPKLWQLIASPNRKVCGISFKIGGGGIETSRHFLSFAPVLQFINKNKIGRIETTEPFFIGNSFKFYKLMYPQIEVYVNSAKIEYEDNLVDDGFEKIIITDAKNDHVYLINEFIKW